MSTLPPNITEIINAHIKNRIKKEVDSMEQEIVKKLKERIPEIIAETVVDICAEPQLLEFGNIIRFEIHTKE